VPVWNFVRHSVYQDSVTLMRLTQNMHAVAGVRRAAAMMGTPANRALLEQAGLLDAEGRTAGPTDLVIAGRAASVINGDWNNGYLKSKKFTDFGYMPSPQTNGVYSAT